MFNSISSLSRIPVFDVIVIVSPGSNSNFLIIPSTPFIGGAHLSIPSFSQHVPASSEVQQRPKIGLVHAEPVHAGQPQDCCEAFSASACMTWWLSSVDRVKALNSSCNCAKRNGSFFICSIQRGGARADRGSMALGLLQSISGRFVVAQRHPTHTEILASC